MNIWVTLSIALATFLWYRKGRLWNFYDSIVKDSVKQVTNDSLDRKAWEIMARKKCNSLGEELFNSLFRFEIEYLRKIIIDNKHALWIVTVESNGKRQITITDKEKYAIYKMKEIFYEDIRYCGLGLFIKSIAYFLQKKKEPEDTGYIETSLKE
jgi:hypothetical protein